MKKLLVLTISVFLLFLLAVPIYAHDESLKADPRNVDDTKLIQQIATNQKKAIESSKNEAATLSLTLDSFKDFQTKMKVEKIAESLNLANSQILMMTVKNIILLDDILSKLHEKVDSSSLKPKDPTVLLSSIDEAKKALDEARKSAVSQSNHYYVPSVQTKETLKLDLVSERGVVYNDVNSMYLSFIQARNAVSNATRVAIQFLGE